MIWAKMTVTGNKVHKILVGNKCDMVSKRKVQREKAEEFAHKFGIPYVETSAKEGHNVQQVALPSG